MRQVTRCLNEKLSVTLHTAAPKPRKTTIPAGASCSMHKRLQLVSC